jgi:hypothetical protein
MVRDKLILAALIVACDGGTDEGPGQLPPPVSTVQFDSAGMTRHTGSGLMEWCVRGTVGEVWYGALDPMFVSFSTGVALLYGAPGGHLTVPRRWTVAAPQAAGDSARASLALSTQTPGVPVVYIAFAGTVSLDSLRTDSVLFGHGSYDVQTQDPSPIPVGTVTVTIQARPATLICP